MIFNQSKYTKWYFSIVNRAKQEIRSKKLKYFESHHIIPTSLGGKNTKDNKVLLTFKEHWTCHRLLVKMAINPIHINKMNYALYCMSRLNDEQMSRSLSFHQKMKSMEANRIASSTRNHKPNLGNKHSIETIELLRKKATGKKHSIETIKKIQQNNIITNNSRGSKVKKALTGRVKNNNHKQKLSDSMKSYYANNPPSSLSHWRTGDDHHCSGMKWISNSILKKSIRIKATEVDQYLTDGWWLGKKQKW